MQIAVHEIGRSKSKVIVVDDALINARHIVDAAAAMAPFPCEDKTAYPGRRHQIGPADRASAYVMDIMKRAGPLIQHHYEVDNFRMLEASFSLATTPPEDMSPKQRMPHYDLDDPNHMAILLHLHRLPNTGTAFYRHVASDLEQVGRETSPLLRNLVQAELDEDDGASESAFQPSTARYEKIFQVEGRFNRLVIYQGCLIHSGYFSPDFNYSSDPASGRLTANVFIQTAKG